MTLLALLDSEGLKVSLGALDQQVPYTSGIAFQFRFAGSGEGVTVSLVARSNSLYYLEITVDSCKKYEKFSAYPSFSSPMVAVHKNVE